MYMSNIWNRLKKKLRWRRRWLILGCMLIVTLLSMWSLSGPKDFDEPSLPAMAANQLEVASEQDQILEMIRSERRKRDTFVQKLYVCGEETQKLGNMNAEQIIELHKQHLGWTITLGDQGQVYFSEKVNDLSQACKEKAFFGLDESGNLSLFDGVPKADHVIRTFFQLNVDFLRSSLPIETVNQLYEGIRVTDLQEYYSVLSTFSDYAVEAGNEANSQ